MSGSGLSYADAGVDVEAGERAVALMRAHVAAAQRPETLGGLGGFAGLFDASALKGYKHPLLATSTDGCGTKVAVAQALDVHDTIGIDLVAMIVDDLVVCGAQPLFLTDYIACGRVHPERIAALVSGVARGCTLAGTALLGGETAEHPGLLGPDEYDLAGAGVGVVEADNLLSAELVRPGDVLVAMASSGLHCNGYSLARAVLFGEPGQRAGLSLDAAVPAAWREASTMGAHTLPSQTLGEQSGGAQTLGAQTLGQLLLTPTRIYALDCLDLLRAIPGAVRVYSHVTGGGLAANLARVLPTGLHADVDRSTWQPAPVFELISTIGGVQRGEMERTFNQGIGMFAVVDPAQVESVSSRLAELGVSAWVCGVVRAAAPNDRSDAPAKGGTGGSVTLVGHHTPA